MASDLTRLNALTNAPGRAFDEDDFVRIYAEDIHFIASLLAEIHWRANGNHIYSNNSGNVGIGLTGPLHKLQVAGTVKMGGDNSFLHILTEVGDEYTVLIYKGGGNRDVLHLRKGGSGTGDYIEFIENETIVAKITDGGGAEFGGDVTIAGELKGARELIQFSKSGTINLSGSVSYFDFGNVETSASKGWVAPRSGSIVGLSLMYDCTDFELLANIEIQVRKNGSIVFASTIPNTVDDDLKDYATQARGVDTFAAGDIITMTMAESSGTAEATFDDLIGSVEIVMDS